MGPDGRPDCGYCAERLAVNVGLLTENTELKRKLTAREPATAQVTDEMVARAADGLGRWWQERSHMAHRVDDDDRAMARAALAAAFDDEKGAT